MASSAGALATAIGIDTRNKVINGSIHKRLTIGDVNLVLIPAELDEGDFGHSQIRTTKRSD